MALLHRTVGRAKLGETVFLAHLLRDLEPSQPLDLPLRRTGPDGVGAPYDVVRAHALDQHAHQRARTAVARPPWSGRRSGPDRA